MTTLANLSLRVDSDGVIKADKSLDALEKQSGKTEKSTKQLTKSVDNVNREMKQVVKTQGEVSRSTRELTVDYKSLAITGAAAIGALGVGMAALIQHSASNAKEMKNLANIAGEGFEQFQALSFAVNKVGISSEQLADISKDTLEKLGEFTATGGGGFKDFFEQVAPKVGITAKSLQHLSGPQVLIRVKKAMDDANISAQQQSFYLESIASDTTALIPLLANNARGMQEQAKRAHELGLVLSEVDATSLIEAGKAATEFGAAMHGAGNQVAVYFAPVITESLNNATDALTVFIHDGDSVAKAVDIMTTAGTALAVVMGGRMIPGLINSGIALGAQAKAATQSTVRLNAMGQVIGRTTLKTRLATTATRVFTGSLAVLGGPLGVLATTVLAIGAYAWSSQDAVTDVDDLRGATDSLKESLKSLTESQIEVKLLNLKPEIKKFKGEITELGKEITDLKNIEPRLYISPISKEETWIRPPQDTITRKEANRDTAQQKLNETLEQEIILRKALSTIRGGDTESTETKTVIEQAQLAAPLKDDTSAQTEIDKAQFEIDLKREQATEEIELLRESLLTEEEALKLSQDRKQELVNSAYEIGVVAKEKQETLLLKISAKYKADEAKLAAQQKVATLNNYGQLFDGLAGIAESAGDKQSSAYKVLFAASKAFSVAEAIVKIQAGIANASALSYPANIAAMGSVVAATSGIVSTIQGTKMQSFDGGGYTGSGSRIGGMDGKGGFPAMLHPNETVIDHTKNQQQVEQVPVIIEFNITTNDSRSFQDSMYENKNLIKAVISEAFGERGMRGPF